MSLVVKALKGLVDVDENLNYSFSTLPLAGPLPVVGLKEGVVGSSTTPLSALVLLGPR